LTDIDADVFTYDPDTEILTVSTSDNDKAGDYHLVFCVTDDDSVEEGEDKTTCTELFELLIKKFNSHPVLDSGFRNKEVDNYSSLVYELPECTDIDTGDVLTPTFNFKMGS
jgi:hypothetical protein